MRYARPIIYISNFEEEGVEKFTQDLNSFTDNFGSSQTLLIEIDSYGGSIYGLSYMYESLKALRNPKITYCKSKAMSAGAILLASVAKKGFRICSPNATVMLHEISGGVSGNINNVENDTKFLSYENSKWMKILAKSIGKRNSTCIRKLIDNNSRGGDLYLSANDAQKFGFVDHVCYITLEIETNYNFLQQIPGKK